MMGWKVVPYFMTDKLAIVREDNSIVEGPIHADLKKDLHDAVDVWNRAAEYFNNRHEERKVERDTVKA